MRNLIIAIVFVFVSCDETQEIFEAEITAEATLYALELVEENQYSTLETEIGLAEFSQDGDVVRLHISLSSMTPNTFKAVHIHYGTVEEPGRHWNRGSLFASCDSLNMGNFWGRPFIGDVGNVRIDANGNGQFTLRTDLWRINSGDEKDVLNKPIIIHDLPQDFAEECNPNHDHTHQHNNPKIGGGTITLLTDVPLNEQSIAAPEHLPDFLICR